MDEDLRRAASLPRRSLLKWLELIQLRPGIYLGVSPPDYGRMLDRLEGFVAGYFQAVDAHAVHDPGLDLYFEFSRHLKDRLGSLGIGAIRETTTSDAEAWEAFWNLLEEFSATKNAG